ncbi:hypothetical protein PHISCL_05630 [Aspergillus sclerotialis]|uniref:U3 small nucleolar ribonucleoprotein protein MPP10 n=1 Tax=Aspergillus sclerotialis TaxID=2070753 RepID=A0A3A2ZRW1_9EURO|nr:hypothetical protein PHISCL_05630 [Aspergillus sclerotialis]
MVGKKQIKQSHLTNSEVSPSQNSLQSPFGSESITPCAFLNPTARIHSSTVDFAKYFLDPLAFTLNDCKPTSQYLNKKRKRPGIDEDSVNRALHLEQLYVTGFTPEQIWEQAIRILDSTGKGIQHDYTEISKYSRNVLAKTQATLPNFNNTIDDTRELQLNESVGSIDGFTDKSSISSAEVAHLEPAGNSENPGPKSIISHSIDEAADETASPEGTRERRHDHYTQDRYGLNDGFFSIDDFNKQSEFFERHDAKGGPNDSESDYEEIDWHTDPLNGEKAISAANAHSLSYSSDPSAGNSTSDSSDEEGPTFGNAHLDEISEANDHESANDDHGEATNLSMTGEKYSDFFSPSSVDSTHKLSSFESGEPVTENDVQRAAADVRRDLFDDEMSVEDASDAADFDYNKTQHSAHEKRRARIADEIRRLEAANVSKKAWMLGGEARAAERPMNSLIEEDLDFERIGKSVSVPTNEVSEGIEELIKRRIVSKEFDEVNRRYPGVSDGETVRRGRFELDDTKPKQSLTELYESDHLRATDPNYIDPKNQKLRQVHNEVTGLWKEISTQLDTLSSYHFKPKALQADINVLTDVATITMEDARPTMDGIHGGSASLAPQEIYTPTDGQVAGELVLKNGVPMAKEEMTRDAKVKLRRQHKKQKKAHGEPIKRQSGEATEKQRLVSDLKNRGVKVIGKQGEITDVQGNKVGKQTLSGGDNLKL